LVLDAQGISIYAYCCRCQVASGLLDAGVAHATETEDFGSLVPALIYH